MNNQRVVKIGEIKDIRRTISDLSYNNKNEKFSEYIELYIHEKIHGTSAAVSYSNRGGLWVQSKDSILTIEDDNAGFANHVESNNIFYIEEIKKLASFYNIDLDLCIITIYMEWCGGKIQKKSCVKGLSKRAIIFSKFKVSNLEPSYLKNGLLIKTNNQPQQWKDTYYKKDNIIVYIQSPENMIFNISAITPRHTINFNIFNFEVEIKDLIDIMKDYEKNSRVALFFNVPENVGEGIVASFTFKSIYYRFKIKGTSHTKSKIKKLVVDDKKEAIKVNLINLVITDSRCEQAWQEIFGIENEKHEPNSNKIGDFLRWIHKDIIKEHTEDYEKAKIKTNEINRKISIIAKIWFTLELSTHNEDNNV